MAKRIIVGIVLAGLFFALLFAGGIFRMAAFSIGAVIAVYEMGSLIHAKDDRARPFWAPAYIFALLNYPLTMHLGRDAAVILWLLCFVAVAVDRIFTKIRTNEDCAYSVFVLVYPLSLFWALSVLISGNFHVNGDICMLLLFACPLLGDALAFFGGSFFGRHKLCPAISPKKTVEGSVAGFIGGALGGLLTWYLQGYFDSALSLLPMVIVGLICGGIGQIGDLFASLLKRWAGIKDYGRLFPGHGGVMDRLDSVLMCAPIIMIYAWITLLK